MRTTGRRGWLPRGGQSLSGRSPHEARMVDKFLMQNLVIRDLPRGASRPRIALVIDRFDGRGGAEIYTRDLAGWLANRGCEVHVFARSIGPMEQMLPLVFHEVEPRSDRVAFAAAGSERLAAIRPDVSHDMGAALGCDVFQPHVGSSLACQRAADMAHPAWYRPLRRLMRTCSRRRDLVRFTKRQFAAGGSLIVAVSRRVATDITALHGVPAERIRVVYNGVDADRFDAVRNREAGNALRRRLGFDADDVVVIAVAHNHRLKGLHVLERVIRRLRRDALPVRLLTCGGSGHGRSDAAVVHVGRVTDVAAYYAAADIAVQPSFYDACSLTTLESLASGLPVITTRHNGASELITPGVDGFVIDGPRDTDALAECLAVLAVDRWRRAVVGLAARQLARAHGSNASFAAIIGVYAEVLAARGRTLEWRNTAGPASCRRPRLAA